MRGISNASGRVKHDSTRYQSQQSGQYDFDTAPNQNLNINSSRLRNIKAQMNQSGYDTTFRAFSTKRTSIMNSTQRDVVSIGGGVKELMGNNFIQLPRNEGVEWKQALSPPPRVAVRRIAETTLKFQPSSTGHVILGDTAPLADLLPEIPQARAPEAKSALQEHLQHILDQPGNRHVDIRKALERKTQL